MATCQDLFTASLQRIGVVGSGQTVSAEDAATAFARFNDWIDALKLDGLTIYTITRTTWALTGASSYTVGTGGTINIDRPVNPAAITNIAFQDTALPTVYEYPLGPVLTEDEYAAIPYKTLTAVYPMGFYYNPTFPLGALKPFPIPTSSTLQGVIYTPTPVSEFPLYTTVVALPPGYRRMLISGLAVELCPDFSRTPSDTLRRIAIDSKADVQRANIRLVDLSMPAVVNALFGGEAPSNIYTGP